MGNLKNARKTKKARVPKASSQPVIDDASERVDHDEHTTAANQLDQEPKGVAVDVSSNLDEGNEQDQNKETLQEAEDANIPEVETASLTETTQEDKQHQPVTVTEPTPKRRRGPTRLKHIARDPNEKQHVDFTELGQPCGPGSVLLSSYLGPLVREHVPVTLDNWKKVGEDMKVVLWKSVESRFDLDEEFKKAAVLQQMGCLWRSSKSRLVTSVRNAKTIKERMNLCPKNVSTTEWRKFVREKTSDAFKVVSDIYKERRQKQIPHTSGRKGMVRLKEDMVKTSLEPDQVTRLRVWVKSRTKKDGTPVNVDAAEKILKASEIECPSDSKSNPNEDMLTQILGPDNPGRLRAMGRGMSMTKLACLQIKNNCMAVMEDKQSTMEKEIYDLRQLLARKNKQSEETDVGENSIHKSVNTKALPICYLLDWSSSDDKVAEGRVVSHDPDELVNGIPLGPKAVKVLVETSIKPETFLWRPAHQLFTIEDAIGEMIAWQADYCIVPNAGFIPEESDPKSPSTVSNNRCKLKDYITDEEVVAVGRWVSQEPKALVNGLPLGPSAVKVYLDEVLNHQAFVWRPTVEKRKLEDYIKCFVAWPANRVVMEERTPNSTHEDLASDKSVSPISQTQLSTITPSAPSSLERTRFKENQKCQLLDLSGNNVVVAEGHWSSNDPELRVHFVPLGIGACRVLVDVVKVKDASVWRTTSDIVYMEDALGSPIAWPEDKVIMVKSSVC